jgi:predicted sulfurtransferase
MSRCDVVEISNLADVLGYPCAKISSQQCSDCGIAICDAHTETCDICRDVFCPSCMSFHQAAHPKPATAENRLDQERKTA